ncbi:CsgG/HfaB family protein [Burkholderia sp. Ac-20365]|uniref:CsgG/HfaB family protein n=1 Tax=Burkholderia sp. Ac-20365 TaxID=2703897 RepID=UPI00197B9ED4|nr:CsgG/HfaB family protein [Burkholderia sp. Ac-20365]MBN3761369.1 peptidoglycan-binding protein [Burkholderia sp. Ac-20365]
MIPKLTVTAAASMLLLSACAQMQLGGGNKMPDSTAVAGTPTQTEGDGLKHCAAPLGTVAIIEDQTAPWFSFLTAQYQLGSTVPVLKLLVQQSNCFVIVDRGRGLDAAMGERQLNAMGELRKKSKMHKGQMVSADYSMSPSITFSSQNAGSGTAILNYVPVVGGALASVAGTMNTKEASTVLTLTDNRSSVQLAAATGTARNIDLGLIGSVMSSKNSGAVGGYSNTPQGKVVVAALTDSLNNLVVSVQQYRAQNVKGGLGAGGQLHVN